MGSNKRSIRETGCWLMTLNRMAFCRWIEAALRPAWLRKLDNSTQPSGTSRRLENIRIYFEDNTLFAVGTDGAHLVKAAYTDYLYLPRNGKLGRKVGERFRLGWVKGEGPHPTVLEIKNLGSTDLPPHAVNEPAFPEVGIVINGDDIRALIRYLRNVNQITESVGGTVTLRWGPKLCFPDTGGSGWTSLVTPGEIYEDRELAYRMKRELSMGLKVSKSKDGSSQREIPGEYADLNFISVISGDRERAIREAPSKYYPRPYAINDLCPPKTSLDSMKKFWRRISCRTVTYERKTRQHLRDRTVVRIKYESLLAATQEACNKLVSNVNRKSQKLIRDPYNPSYQHADFGTELWIRREIPYKRQTKYGEDTKETYISYEDERYRFWFEHCVWDAHKFGGVSPVYYGCCGENSSEFEKRYKGHGKVYSVFLTSGAKFITGDWYDYEPLYFADEAEERKPNSNSQLIYGYDGFDEIDEPGKDTAEPFMELEQPIAVIQPRYLLNILKSFRGAEYVYISAAVCGKDWKKSPIFIFPDVVNAQTLGMIMNIGFPYSLTELGAIKKGKMTKEGVSLLK